MKKFVGLKKVLDGINQLSQTDGPVEEAEVNDSLKADDFTLAKVNRYGFPYHATCLAIDHVQKLIAIGTATGAIRICGKPGVEFHIHHEANAPVNLLSFLINEGGLVSVCNDATLHIWSLRQNQPALIQSLNFRNNERITALHSQFGSKWLYVGTERGNIFMVHVESFQVSGYVINWNHVIDVSCKQHPGPCIEIKTNPQDQNKLLLNFESGVCIIWDLRSKKILYSYGLEKPNQYVTCISWHTEGKQFMTGHRNGELSTWNYKNAKKPDERTMPHATSKSKDEGVCCPVLKLRWLAGRMGESPIILFSGGMPYGNKNKGLTIMRGRSKSLLLSDHVVDFQCLLSSPLPTEFPEPQALFVLLKNEIVVFDLLGSIAPSLPWFELPYRFDIHESAITCIEFVPECPNILLKALHSLSPPHLRRDNTNQSNRPWPLNGGQEGDLSQEATIIITGHVDGSVKFWDATSNLLILCHKFSVSRLFERSMSRQSSTTSSVSKGSVPDHYDDPFAIQHISFCPYGRVLAVTCQSYFVAVFKFSSKENVIETAKIDVNFCVEVGHEAEDSPTSLNDSFNNGLNDSSHFPHSISQQRLSAGQISPLYHPPLRTIGVKWPAGFQPVCVCQQFAYEPMPVISALCLSSSYGLVTFGNSLGLAVIDYIQGVSVMVIMSNELGVAGEWTDSSSPQTPVNKRNSGGSSTPSGDKDSLSLNGHLNESKHDRHDSKHSKRKERVSRVISSNIEQLGIHHQKLTKKHSVNSNNSFNGKDKEDGLIIAKERLGEPLSGSIQYLIFAYSYTRKGANLVCPSLWVGTSTGCTAVIALSIPSAGEQRGIQSVLALCTGTLLEHRNCVLNITQLDKSGNICLSPFEFWRDGNSPNPSVNRTNLQTINSESNAKTFVCITTEKQIKVKTLPNMKQYAIVDDVVGSDGFIVKAQSMQIDGGNCLGILTTDGSLKIYSLPTLRPLLDVQCGISISDYRMIRTFTMGKGEAAFLSSPTEIQRVAFTKVKEQSFIDDHGCLFTMRQNPEPKAKGFFESFFSGPSSTLDREELFGPKSGTTRKVADYVPGSGMETLRNQTDTAAGAIGKAKMALVERGEKLDKLDERTQEMMAKAQNFSSAAKALADKYQKKKWYQL